MIHPEPTDPAAGTSRRSRGSTRCAPGRGRRVLLTATLATTLVATLAPPAPAQSEAKPPHRTPRSKVFAIVGALVGGAIGFGFARASESDKGACAKVQCLIVASTVGGALFGYFIGREYDRTYAMRYRGVPPLRPSSLDADLAGDPVALAVGDSTVAVAGSEGVQLFESGPGGLSEQARRAGGLRGLAVVAIAPHTGWLALGSPSGLYLFPPRHGPGALVRQGAIGAATATPERIFFGVDDRIEVVPADSDGTRLWPGVALGEPVRDLAVDSVRSLLWVVTDRQLAAYRIAGDTLTRVGAAALEGAGRRLARAGDTVAVALGERGVDLFDTHDPAAPQRFARWTTAHFVYDVAIDQGRLFAAAGPEGVYVVDLHGDAPQTLGLARDLGFAAALASRAGYTYILDRRANVLRRIVSDF